VQFIPIKLGTFPFLILVVIPVILANQNLTENNDGHNGKKSDLENNSTKVDHHDHKEKPREESLVIDKISHDKEEEDLADFDTSYYESDEGIKTGEDYYNDYMSTHKGGQTTHKGNAGTTHKGDKGTTPHKGGAVTTHKGEKATTPHHGHNG
ncbi:hypothetical protein BLA29_013103, partial [Euroglyphus maynei]